MPLTRSSAPSPPALSFRLHVAGLSDIGRVRRRNEDCLELDPDLGLAVVADGMGGHPGGDVASRTAARHAMEGLRTLRTSLPRDGITGPSDRAISEVVTGAHRAVRARAAAQPSLAGMGTTLTALAADPEGGTWLLGHVGDSRAYLHRRGSLGQLTRDDTWVQERVEADQLTPEEARRHPFGHVLTQCVGLEATPSVQVVRGGLQPRDVFLLCTDGLTGALEDHELAEVLMAHAGRPGLPPDIHGAATALVAQALERGATDNVTVALVAVS